MMEENKTKILWMGWHHSLQNKKKKLKFSRIVIETYFVNDKKKTVNNIETDAYYIIIQPLLRNFILYQVNVECVVLSLNFLFCSVFPLFVRSYIIAFACDNGWQSIHFFYLIFLF